MTIKELRKQQGLTLANFAKSIGIGMSTLTGYEAGVREPSKKTLAAIKEVYGVDLAAQSAPVIEAPAAPEIPATTETPAPKKPRSPKKAPVAKASVEAKPFATNPAAPKIIIQSMMGGEITIEEILSKVGDVDTVYVKPEENAAYWLKGDSSGAVNLW